MPPRLDPNRVAKWRRWLEHEEQPQPSGHHSIWSEHVGIAHRRHVFTRTVEIAAANPSMPPSALFEYLTETYIVTQAIAVRRQTETSPRVATLGQLVDELARDLGAVGGPVRVELAEMTPDQAAGHQQTLAAASEAMRRYVDGRIAHMDKRPREPSLSVADVDGAIDALFGVFRAVEVWLTASSTVDLVPTTQENWEAVFGIPWLGGDGR